MRPHRLELEGFTSFRERLAVDFSGLDLFAITGPTGVGKSSLIDALVFALYGQVPRVGDDYKQLISHGVERLSVLLEFSVGAERFRVARTARPTGASQQRLERLSATGAEPIADRVREIRSGVEQLLGLDYDGFTRSVVLPQGQFDAFLKGEPKERRKILVALLNLGLYDEMQKIANQKATAARQEADFIAQQLAKDFADATPEALEARQAVLARAEREAAAVERSLAAIAEGLALAQTVRTARRDHEALAKDAAQEEQKQKAAEGVLVGVEETRARLEAELALAAQRMAALGFDEARHAALVAAKPVAEQLAALRQQLARLERSRQEGQKKIEVARKAAAVAEAGLAPSETSQAEAEARLEAARAARDDAHRQHAALLLRRHLKPGEVCPVCAQTVKALPKGAAPALEAAEAGAREADALARSAREAAQNARLQHQRARGELEALGREIAQAEAHRQEPAAAVATAEASLRAAGFVEADLGDPGRLVARIEDELQTLEAARRGRADLERGRAEVETRRSALEAQVAAASAQRDAARARLEEIASRRGRVERALEEAAGSLRSLSDREGWSGLAAASPGRDEADVLESRRADRQREVSELAAGVATLRKEVQLLEQKIVRSAELRENRAKLDTEAALLRTLADHLRANELVAWVQEEALGRLAEDASRHLAKLSEGRYELRLGTGEASEAGGRAEQDFSVVDHWNADSVRSVKTLSGGETFLASLALALALAEGLAHVSAEGAAGEALESLFLDEGFGSLDAETLDTVVSALDALHGGDRMVGIVTHVRDLAERLPARLEVRRSGHTATASIA